MYQSSKCEDDTSATGDAPEFATPAQRQQTRVLD